MTDKAIKKIKEGQYSYDESKTQEILEDNREKTKRNKHAVQEMNKRNYEKIDLDKAAQKIHLSEK